MWTTVTLLDTMAPNHGKHDSSYLPYELRYWDQITVDYTVLLDHSIVSNPVGENIVENSDSPPTKVSPIIEVGSGFSVYCTVGDKEFYFPISDTN